MRVKPNFLIIGSNKGGTTSLFQYLTAHPEVFKPTIKEPMFFNYYDNQGEDGNFRAQLVIKSLESYNKLFEGSELFKAAGESSTSYLANPYCAKHIYDFNPSMKIIAVLRNPIERAFSNYLMYVRWGDEKRNFSKALKDELEGKELPQGKQYIYLGYYLQALEVYKKQFGTEQLRVYLNEDLKHSPYETYKDICNFIGVNDDFVPDFSRRYNTNDKVDIRPVYKMLRYLDDKYAYTKCLPYRIKKHIYKKPVIKQRDKALLLSIYKSEIESLSNFLNRDLSHWLT
ncbi:sulfotransferase family protein [Aestuariibaculum marinum]|uniref:Sulfotransferase n=1 Tax=Aestuariibaculum marinum TaxID=2683592 RepID=A0A8J6PU65_9FLAO|nr:sulfotransferase [Aestuariibaculum marinum]MBD0823865.1 sulfotransferase [Aestuariibaculum marinum]